MKKDWTGNYKSIYTTLGSSAHSEGEREINDYYATEPRATELLLEVEQLDEFVLEPACGEGHLSEILNKEHRVTSTDLINRGYGDVMDFFTINEFTGDIVTNPPYSLAQEFVEHSLSIIPEGNKVCMFLKLTFLEGKKRKLLFEKFPPKTVYVSSSRLKCAKNGKFDEMGSSAAAYAWFVWIKGYGGETVIKWIN